MLDHSKLSASSEYFFCDTLPLITLSNQYIRDINILKYDKVLIIEGTVLK